MRTGFALFILAVVAVFRVPLAALRIIWAPYLVTFLVSCWFYATGESVGMVMDVSIYILDAFAVALVAVGWHRFRLLGEAPGLIGARGGPARIVLYTVHWIMLGLFVAVAVVLACLPLLGLGWWFDEAATVNLVDWAFSGYWHGPATLVTLVVIWLFTWLFFRIAMGLPDIAIREEQSMRVTSWKNTGAIEPAVVSCAGLAALGTMLLMSPVLFAYDMFPWEFIFVEPLPIEEADPYIFSPMYFALTTFFWILIPLFGASVLTEVYKAAQRGA